MVTKEAITMVRRLGIRGLTSQINKTGIVTKTGSEIITDMLKNYGVKTVFCYSGGANLPLIDALERGKITRYSNANEQCVGHSATSYARVTGGPGVAIVTSGPGITNMVTPMQDAQSDGVPLITISAQVSTTAMGYDSFQECPATLITKPCCKWNYVVLKYSELVWSIHEAFAIAVQGRPGAIHLDIPKDVLTHSGQVELSSLERKSPQLNQNEVSKCGINDDVDISKLISQAASLINNAKKPLFILGHGASKYSDLVRKLIIKSKVPAVMTLHGLGTLNTDSEFSLQMVGMHGSAAANYAIQRSDVIFSLGSRFDDRTTGNVARYAVEARQAFEESRGGIIHADIRKDIFGKSIIPNIAILSDLEVVLNQLIKEVEKIEIPQYEKIPVNLNMISSLKGDITLDGEQQYLDAATVESKSQEYQKASKDIDEELSKMGLNPKLVLHEIENRRYPELNTSSSKIKQRTKWLNEILDLKRTHPFGWLSNSEEPLTQSVLSGIDIYLRKTDTYNNRSVRFCTGVGNHQMMATQFLSFHQPNSIVSSGSLGVMGAGLPYAIGMQIANPNDLVILVDGDGSFGMTHVDLQTIAKCNFYEDILTDVKKCNNVRHKLPIKMIIMQDNSLSMVRVWQSLFFKLTTEESTNYSPNFALLSEAHGIPAVVCNKESEVQEKLKTLFETSGPVVGIFRVTPDICLPMIVPGAAMDEMFLLRDRKKLYVNSLQLSGSCPG